MTLEPPTPEGLSPIEVGKQVHEHTKEPHEPEGGSRHSRTVQIGEEAYFRQPLTQWDCKKQLPGRPAPTDIQPG